ncbi:hypothetical protein TIFTF001_007900 [Ficus carica]|uniref:Uncharacterized protein n=1 Tax=Ficus carica TaxID=3494 RepID=A0AA88A3T0_FICCA|nr:hypothetical protein TIFTF001_007900 [Ficus carica]
MTDPEGIRSSKGSSSQKSEFEIEEAKGERAAFEIVHSRRMMRTSHVRFPEKGVATY